MRKFASLIATAAMLALYLTLSIGVVPVAAAGPSCDAGQIQVTWYEDASFGGHTDHICFAGNGAGQISIANLTERPQFCVTTPCGLYDGTECNRSTFQPNPDSKTWNDCISSLKVWLPTCHWGVSFYLNSDYDALFETLWGPSGGGRVTDSSLPSLYNDAISSMYRVYRSVCFA